MIDSGSSPMSSTLPSTLSLSNNFPTPSTMPEFDPELQAALAAQSSLPRLPLQPGFLGKGAEGLTPGFLSLTAFGHASAAPLVVVDTPEIDPDVREICARFGIDDDRIIWALNKCMNQRMDTFVEDLDRIKDRLEPCANPAGLLRTMIKEMEQGIFVSTMDEEDDIEQFARDHKLDNMAKIKLSEVLSNRPDTREKDLEILYQRVGWSSSPSGLLMWLLKKMAKNEALPNADKKTQPGSYNDRMEKAKREAKRNARDDDRDRGRDRGSDRGRRHQSPQRNGRRDSQDRGNRGGREREPDRGDRTGRERHDRDRGGEFYLFERYDHQDSDRAGRDGDERDSGDYAGRGRDQGRSYRSPSVPVVY